MPDRYEAKASKDMLMALQGLLPLHGERQFLRSVPMYSGWPIKIKSNFAIGSSQDVHHEVGAPTKDTFAYLYTSRTALTFSIWLFFLLVLPYQVFFIPFLI